MDRSTREIELQARRERLSSAGRERLAARYTGAERPQVPACLVPLAAGRGVPLFCAHPAGGDVLAYAALAGHARRPLYGLQAPGLYGEAAPLTSIEALASRYVDAVCSAAPTGPVLLAGWSLGAQVIFQMGHELVARGRAPALLALVDADPDPVDPATLPAGGDSLPWLLSIAEYVERVGGLSLGVTADELARLPEPVRLARFLQALRGAQIPGAPVPTPERLSRLLLVFESNSRALARYRPQPLSAKLTLLSCAASSFEAGWSALSDQPLVVHRVPGDHYTLMAEPQVAALAARLEELAQDALMERS
jgi:thioesterase domain-containing protein